jgi:hypothetical protein
MRERTPETTIFKVSIHAHISNYKVKNVANVKWESEESGYISNVGPNRHVSCIHAVPIPELAALAGDPNRTGGGAIRNAGGA